MCRKSRICFALVVPHPGGAPCTSSQTCLSSSRDRGWKRGIPAHVGVGGASRVLEDSWVRSEEALGLSSPLDFLDLCHEQAAGQFLPGPAAGDGQEK